MGGSPSPPSLDSHAACCFARPSPRRRVYVSTGPRPEHDRHPVGPAGEKAGYRPGVPERCRTSIQVGNIRAPSEHPEINIVGWPVSHDHIGGRPVPMLSQEVLLHVGKGCAGGDPEVPFPCAARTSRQHRPGRRSSLVAALVSRRTVVAAPRHPRPARCCVVGSCTGPAGVAARAGAARGSVPGRGRNWACARHSERTEETCRTRTPWMAGAR